MLNPKDILLYEIHASLWAGYMGTGFLQSLASRYYAWKVNRKFARYLRAMKVKAYLASQENKQ